MARDPRALLSWDGWGLADAPFVAGVIAGLRGVTDAERARLASCCLDGMRDEVAGLLAGGTVVPNRGGWDALEEEMRYRNGGVVPVAGDAGGTPAPSWDDMLARTAAVDAAVSGYLGAPRPVATGNAAVDSLLGGGIYPGLNVLMAEPGAGKTALAVQMLASNAARGGSSLMFSIEMPVSQVKMRVASWLSAKRSMDAAASGRHARYDLVRWASGWREADSLWDGLTWDRAERAAPEAAAAVRSVVGRDPTGMPLRDVMAAMGGDGGLVAEVALAVGDDTALAIADAEEHVMRRMAVLHGVRDIGSITSYIRSAAGTAPSPPLVCVDYMQLVMGTPEAERMGETEVTKQVSGELARCASETGCPVLCIAAKRKGSGTEMVAARGSSAITYDAQSVLDLDGDQDGELTYGLWRAVTLTAVKNRSGRADERHLWFDGAHNAFSCEADPPRLGVPPF